MPTSYQTPGVYINEVPAGSKPIEGVATSIAAFVGLAPSGPANTPRRITSWLEFEKVFGDPEPGGKGAFMKNAYLAHAVQGFFANGGGVCWVVRLGTDLFGRVPQERLTSAPIAKDGEQDAVPAADLFTFLQRPLKRTKDGEPEVGLDDGPVEETDPEQIAKDRGLKVRVTQDPDQITAQTEAKTTWEAEWKTKIDAAAELDKKKLLTDQKAAEQKGEAWLKGEPTIYDLEVVEPLDPTAPDEKTDRKKTYGNVTLVQGPRFLPSIVHADPFRLVDVKEGTTPLRSDQRRIELATAATATQPASTELTLAAPDRPDIEAPPTEKPTDLLGDERTRTGMAGLKGTDEITILCMPDLMALQKGADDISDVHQKMEQFCRLGATKRMAILDPPPGLSKEEIFEFRQQTNAGSDCSTLYWPWLVVKDPFTGGRLQIPPCGHVAGVWAGTDERRGVHKAPANETISGALAVAVEISDGDQGNLNLNGINCIRSFPGRGTRIWGARTLSTDPEWRYLNVRRLINYVSASILRSTQWAVFEPNDEFLWGQLRVSVSNFLTGVWRGGALFGSSPDEAFFVKCDRDTNPPDAIDAGQVNVHIGVAPVKPAEFVIFQISQYQVGAS